MNDWIILQLFRLTPTRMISRLAGRLARTKLSRMAIRRFARLYGIDLTEAEQEVSSFPHFNAFFTRKLKPHLRTVASDPSAIISPCDGKVAAVGTVERGMMLQAKNTPFTIRDLLGLSEQEAEKYDGGGYMTIYLSPKDYHRIHVPVDGSITRYTYIPGTLFPVNAFGVRTVYGLFARNERLTTYIESPDVGSVAVVKVGAMMVGSVKVNYGQVTTNVRGGKLTSMTLPESVPVKKGDDLGHFEFGSTVILVFERGHMKWDDSLQQGSMVKFGQFVGSIVR